MSFESGLLVKIGQHSVEPVLKDHPIDHKNMVSQDRWSLVTTVQLH